MKELANRKKELGSSQSYLAISVLELVGHIGGAACMCTSIRLKSGHMYML